VRLDTGFHRTSLQAKSQLSPLDPGRIVTTFTDSFSTLAPCYDVVLADVWGVIHNGVAAFPETIEALTRFRQAGGTVILITNAPRPAGYVLHYLDRLAVPHDVFDGIVTSGDVSRSVIIARGGQGIFHIGPERDHGLFHGLDLHFAPLERADYSVCSGLFDDTKETAEDYRDLLTRMHARGLFMLCANPDLVVERGDELVYCAGAIADLYESLGGEVLWAGKPHRPIYEQALAAAATLRGAEMPLQRVLAIGDSVRTDITGAARFGADSLFVTGGIHAEELGQRHDPDPATLEKIFAAAGVQPTAVTRRLAW
jgi:HAD superfamily hydrolase (TIGR01459 family)